MGVTNRADGWEGGRQGGRKKQSEDEGWMSEEEDR